MIREPAVAGIFYPDHPRDLQILTEDYLNIAENINLPNVKGIIAPHAGYIYSGKTAGYGYRQLLNRKIDNPNIFLIGPAHHVNIKVSVGKFSAYKTPLGKAKVNQQICEELLKAGEFQFIESAHVREHSLEVQIPFLQQIYPEFNLIPILTGSVDAEILVEILDPYFKKENTIFIFSTDLSHFLPFGQARLVDSNTIKNILNSTDAEIDACGHVPINLAIKLAQRNGYKIKFLFYETSGNITEDFSSVVGYASFAIYK